MRALEADVIVIGSGGAGTYAALRLQQLGLNPLLVTKGFVGKSGCSIFAGNLALSGKMSGVASAGQRYARIFHCVVEQFLRRSRILGEMRNLAGKNILSRT